MTNGDLQRGLARWKEGAMVIQVGDPSAGPVFPREDKDNLRRQLRG